MSEMVERIAKVIAGEACGLQNAEEERMWRAFMPDAIKVLEAMRDPTVEMLTAAQEEWMCVRAAEERGDFVWRAMIDAALLDC